MTDHSKLQQLFQAALADKGDVNKPTQAHPPQVVMPPLPAPEIHAPAVPQPAAVAEVGSGAPDIVPMENAGLSDAESEELGALLDEQRTRLRRKRRRELLVTALVLLGLTGGTAGWFVQSPARRQAFAETMRDLRSAGSVSGMVAKYKLALDRIAVRGQQVEQATVAMGVSTTLKEGEDEYMEKEMQQMAGKDPKGKTIGQRNKLMEEKFGHLREKHKLGEPGGPPVDKERSFDWK